MQEQRAKDLRIAERGAIVSIVGYLLITIIKILIGWLAKSEALSADGLNNLTDIISSIAVLVGLRLARVPPDRNHRYGHWKAENVATFFTSFVMILVGFEVLFSAGQSVINHSEITPPEPLSAIVGVVSAILMYGIFYYNRNLSRQIKSSALMAAAKDNRSDAWSSIGTSAAIVGAQFGMPWLDPLTAFIVGIMIIKTGYDIFTASAFTLTDGFDESLLVDYKEAVLLLKDVKRIRDIQGRSLGANIFVDIIIMVDPKMTVKQSHVVTEKVEKLLNEGFGVFDTDVHVEPDTPTKY